MKEARNKLAYVLAGWFAITSTPAQAKLLGLMHEATVYADGVGKALSAPEGVACYDGGFIAADTGNSRLVRFAFEKREVGDNARFNPEKMVAKEVIDLPSVRAPVRVDLIGDAILVLDGRTHRLFRVGPDHVVSPWQAAALPAETKVGAFSVEPGTGRVQVYDRTRDIVLTLSADGSAANEISVPRGRKFISDLYVDPTGAAYLVDAQNRSLYISQQGRAFQPFVPKFRDDARFPVAMTSLAPTGTLVVIDGNDASLMILSPVGELLGRELEMGRTEGLLYYPSDACTLPSGQLIVADRGNHRIQIFRKTR